MDTFPLLNSILISVVLLVVLGALFFAFRASSSTTVLGWQRQAEKWEAEAGAIRARAERLHNDLDAQMEMNRQLTMQITRLEDRPDLARLLEMLDGFDQRASERHTQLIAAVEQLLSR